MARADDLEMNQGRPAPASRAQLLKDLGRIIGNSSLFVPALEPEAALLVTSCDATHCLASHPERAIADQRN